MINVHNCIYIYINSHYLILLYGTSQLNSRLGFINPGLTLILRNIAGMMV